MRITPLILPFLALLAVTPARADSDQQAVVDHAKVAVDDMRTDSSFGNSADLLKRAKAVMVVPELVKGGFFVGGEGGSGVLADGQAYR